MTPKPENPQDDCDHQDVEEWTCLDCGLDLSEHLSALAYDLYKDKMKYGDE